jgi:hypothetical protein
MSEKKPVKVHPLKISKINTPGVYWIKLDRHRSWTMASFYSVRLDLLGQSASYFINDPKNEGLAVFLMSHKQRSAGPFPAQNTETLKL